MKCHLFLQTLRSRKFSSVMEQLILHSSDKWVIRYNFSHSIWDFFLGESLWNYLPWEHCMGSLPPGAVVFLRVALLFASWPGPPTRCQTHIFLNPAALLQCNCIYILSEPILILDTISKEIKEKWEWFPSQAGWSKDIKLILLSQCLALLKLLVL